MLDFDLRMVLQILGAVLCVGNYLLVQTRRITATQPMSLSIVASGGVVLLVSAIMGADWGLILLEVSWLVMISVTLVIRHREVLAAASGSVAVDDGFVDGEAVTAEIAIASSAIGVAAVESPVLESPVLDFSNTGELELVGTA